MSSSDLLPLQGHGLDLDVSEATCVALDRLSRLRDDKGATAALVEAAGIFVASVAYLQMVVGAAEAGDLCLKNGEACHRRAELANLIKRGRAR